MLMKGTAWSQVIKIDVEKLVDATEGVPLLLQVETQWEDVKEIQMYEKFEKAIYKI